MRFLLGFFALALTLPVAAPELRAEGEGEGPSPLPRNRSLVTSTQPSADVRELRPGLRREVELARAFAASPSALRLSGLRLYLERKAGGRFQSAETARIVRAEFARLHIWRPEDLSHLLDLLRGAGRFDEAGHALVASALVNPKLTPEMRLQLLDLYPAKVAKVISPELKKEDAAKAIRAALEQADMRDLKAALTGLSALESLGAVGKDEIASLLQVVGQSTGEDFARHRSLVTRLVDRLLTHRHKWPEASLVDTSIRAFRASAGASAPAVLSVLLVENGIYEVNDVLYAIDHVPFGYSLSSRVRAELAERAAVDPKLHDALMLTSQTLLLPDDLHGPQPALALEVKAIVERAFTIQTSGCLVKFAFLAERAKWRKEFERLQPKPPAKTTPLFLPP